MPPIDGLGKIVQILQTKISEQDKKQLDKARRSRTNQTSHKSQQKLTTEQLESKIANRLKSISDENATPTLMARYFVESVLIWELGDQILQDSTLSDLTQNIITSFKNNQQVWQNIIAILEQLRAK
jgi:molybdopterin-biosynthesis enzyme MoeA-like protein